MKNKKLNNHEALIDQPVQKDPKKEALRLKQENASLKLVLKEGQKSYMEFLSESGKSL